MTNEDYSPPRERPSLSAPQIERIVDRYGREMARFEAAAQYVATTISLAAGRETVKHLLAFRTKGSGNLREKLGRKRCDHRYGFDRLFEDVGSVVTDLAGVRLVVYAPEDEERLAEIAKKAVPLAPRDDCEARNHKDSGYRATHLLVRVPDDAPTSIRGTICEVQICGVAAHLFNELEHDITYKQDGSISPEETAALQALRSATVNADSLAGRLVRAHSSRVADQATAIPDGEELRFILERQADRALRGDFVGLHRLLNSLIDPLSKAAVYELGKVTTLIERGAARLKQRGVVDQQLDDVVSYSCGLDDMLEEMAALVEGWSEESPLKSALLKVVKGEPS